jgi:hypothetical protein
MLVTLHVDLDERGRPADWTTEIWSGRPMSSAPAAAAAICWRRRRSPIRRPRSSPTDPPEGARRRRHAQRGAALRRAGASHPAPSGAAARRYAPRRCAGLGALPNVYAIEMLMDELAARAGEDPVAYRLSILSEPRARRLIETVAERARWSSRGPAGSGKGLGLAFARYKNRAAYARWRRGHGRRDVKVDRVWCVADAGLVVNPDGGRNQLEGGVVQA